jgi:hypothetical protein
VADAPIRRRAGTPDQLPQGAATQLNEALQAVPDQQPAPTPEPAPAPQPDVLPQAPRRDLSFRPANDVEEFLFGPPRDGEAGAGLDVQGRIAPTPDVLRAAPVIVEAAAQPDAPEQLRVLARLLVHYLGG